MAQIALQRATIGDIFAYLAVERSAIGSKTYSGITSPAQARREIERNVVYIIRVDGETAGTIAYERINNERAYISGIVVAPRFRCRRIAHEAARRIIEELRDVRRIELAVHPFNEASLRLWRAFGFASRAIRPNYFGDGEPRLIMVREQ